MTTQPEALRLAAQLEDTESARLHLMPYAATELRRLHAVNQELVYELKVATEAIEYWGDYAPDYFQKKWDLQSDITAARAAIARAEDQQ
jgi:hypothetical protein